MFARALFFVVDVGVRVCLRVLFFFFLFLMAYVIRVGVRVCLRVPFFIFGDLRTSSVLVFARALFYFW